MDGLSFAIVNSRAVFMDLADDSYFLLERDEEASFLEGLATTGNRPACAFDVAPARCARPEQSLLDDAPRAARTAIGGLARTFLLLRRIRRSLRTVPVAQVLAATVARRALPSTSSDELMAALAAQFRAVRRLCPVAPNCLLDSLALLHWLGNAAAPCCLVFGVKLDPFAAHCWVQTDTVILNDRAEHVLLFEPIRVIACSAAMP